MDGIQAVRHHDEGCQGDVEEYLLRHSVLHWPLHVGSILLHEHCVLDNWNSDSINEEELPKQNRKHSEHAHQEHVFIRKKERKQKPEQVDQVQWAVVLVDNPEHF